MQRADVVVACHDADSGSLITVTDRVTAECIHVLTRVDQNPALDKMATSDEYILTSVKSGVGVDLLRQRILDIVSGLNRSTPATIRLRAGIHSPRITCSG